MTKEYELQLKAWSENDNYTDGLRLWKQRYGEDMSYKMLCMGPNDFNRNKMRAGLVKDVLPVVPAAKVTTAKKPGKVAVLEGTVGELEETVQDLTGNFDDLSNDVTTLLDDVDNLEESFNELNKKVEEFLSKNERPEIPIVKHPDISDDEPVEVRDWHKRTYGLMDERVLLKQKLRDLPDPSRRDDRKTAAYRILDITAELDMLYGMIGYYEEHHRIPENTPIEEQGILYPKNYLNLRTYISRTRTKLKKETDPARRAALDEMILNWERQMKEIEIEL